MFNQVMQQASARLESDRVPSCFQGRESVELVPALAEGKLLEDPHLSLERLLEEIRLS